LLEDVEQGVFVGLDQRWIGVSPMTVKRSSLTACAGSIIAAQLGGQYAFIATGMASAPGKELDAPGPDTLEGSSPDFRATALIRTAH
jgi:hypothetical protein